MLVKNVELCLALCAVLVVDIGALHLLLHVVYLEREDGVAVDSPCGALGVDGRSLKWGDVLIQIEEIAVDELDKVGAVLVGLVDAALECECFDRVDARVADNVLEMPLHGVYPALEVEIVLDALQRIGVVYGCVYIVCLVVVGYGFIENGPTHLGELLHDVYCFSCCLCS